MPKVGIEPTLPEGNRILSPARLPVPPLRPGRVNRSPGSRKGLCASNAVKSPEPWRPTLQHRHLGRVQAPQRRSAALGLIFVGAASRLAPVERATSRPASSSRSALIGLTTGVRLRADRARLHARLRHPRADQLRPRRRVHARRDVRDHVRHAHLRAQHGQGIGTVLIVFATLLLAMLACGSAQRDDRVRRVPPAARRRAWRR